MSATKEVRYNLNRILNGLQSNEKSLKKNALQDLSKIVEQTDSCNLEQVYDTVSKTLVSCFHDRMEFCRENSILMTIQFMNLLEPKDCYLVLVMPAICKRFGVEKVVEESEEVRLLLINLVNLLLTKYTTSLSVYVEEVMDILAKSVADRAPLVKREACSCIILLSQTLPHEFYQYSKILLKPLEDSILHQHWRVRVAVVQAIGATVVKGDEKVLPEISPVLAKRFFDDNANVRMAATNTVGLWILTLRDRYSFFPHLLPLILTSLTDKDEEIAKEGRRLWEAAGRQYLEENQEHYKDRMDFVAEEIEHYPPGVVRPSLGCRVLVEREVGKFLAGVGRELTDWVVSVRLKSAMLLTELVLHAEQNVTQHLHKLLPPLFRAAVDTQPLVALHVLKAAEYLGYFVPANILVNIVVKHIGEGSPGELTTLAAILRSIPPDQLTPHIATLPPIFYHPSFKAEDQKSALGVVKSLLEVGAERALLQAGSEIWACLLTNAGLAATPSIADLALGLLDRFVVLGGGDRYKVHNDYCELLLEKMRENAVWTVHCHEQFMLAAVVDHAGEVVSGHPEEVLRILEVGLAPESDAEAALKTLLSASRLLDNRAVTLSPPALAVYFTDRLLRETVRGVVSWRAGRKAEALRTGGASLLVSCLEVYCGCGGAEGEGLGGVLRPTLLSLAEDSSPPTRSLALSALLLLAPHLTTPDSDDFSSLIQLVVKRLDDCDKEVRGLAVDCLDTLYKHYLDRVEHIDQGVLNFIYTTLLIHLDDPDQHFGKKVLECLKRLGVINRELLLGKIFIENFRNKEICEALIQYIESI